MNVDSYRFLNSTINGIKVEKIPLIIDKGKLTFVYKIHSEQNSFVLPAEGGKFELPFICKKQNIFEWSVIEETYSSLNGLRFKTISTGNVWFLTVRKDGAKIGFYKFTFVGEGPYNQKTDPECYFNIIYHDANLITDNPTEIFRQDFIQPQTRVRIIINLLDPLINMVLLIFNIFSINLNYINYETVCIFVEFCQLCF